MALSKIIDSVVNAETETIEGLIREALDGGISPEQVLREGLIAGMDVVGEEFESGDLFLPEMLASALTMKTGVGLLKPLMQDSPANSEGKVVIGTVEGDIHDIGKNLVVMMLEGAGFEVLDLGVDVAPETFVKSVRETGCHILGLSALLNSTMPVIKTVINALAEAGLRDSVKVLIGGAPITQAYSDEVGSDGYAADAAGAVTKARAFVAAK